MNDFAATARRAVFICVPLWGDMPIREAAPQTHYPTHQEVWYVSLLGEMALGVAGVTELVCPRVLYQNFLRPTDDNLERVKQIEAEALRNSDVVVVGIANGITDGMLRVIRLADEFQVPIVQVKEPTEVANAVQAVLEKIEGKSEW
ncbi:hypothetical protein FACS1894103_5950 [Campylobacterota bacterium]|nr:hypothetical protein FACS1894103_5950 [Campylobacterota bacterium]